MVLKQTVEEKTEDFKAVRLNRLEGFKDGYEVVMKVLRCPVDRTPLILERVIVSSWPYVHGDVLLVCVNCDFKALFGIPEDPVFGMELIVWDDDPIKVIKKANDAETPICPFHMKPMQLTKIWGNRIRHDGKIRVQYKCPEWFLTFHKEVPRE